MSELALSSPIDDLDRRIIKATQAGLPLCVQPYEAVAAQVGIPPQEVMERLRRMLAEGIVRRIGAVPNHYLLGYIANGMSVWNIPDDAVPRRVGGLALSISSHIATGGPGIRRSGPITSSRWCTGERAPRWRRR